MDIMKAEAADETNLFNSNYIVRACAITWLTDCGDLLEHTKALDPCLPPTAPKYNSDRPFNSIKVSAGFPEWMCEVKADWRA
jgi:hypothetical protein